MSCGVRAEDPDYALCVSCHDPHGTGSVEPQRVVNVMLRAPWLTASELCFVCHFDPPVRDTDGDGLTDEEELNVYFTDPLNPDSDGDGKVDCADKGDCRWDPACP